MSQPESASHRVPARGQFVRQEGAAVAESSIASGRYGRLFRNLPAYEPEDAFLDELATAMSETGEGADSGLPAGLTYFGQFVDHDLTFDPASSLERQNDPDALHNFRTPGFDLDSVYGRGPAAQPYLYRVEAPGKPAALLTGLGEALPGETGEPVLTLDDPDGARREDDLPRNAEGLALIGDPRNDENIIVSHLQLAFLKLHNRLLADLADPSQAPIDFNVRRWSDEDDFHFAQRMVRWHYQWLVLKVFLPAICDPAVLDGYVNEENKDGSICRSVKVNLYRPKSVPFIPVEWSVAAYRFGHSLVRPSYHLNESLQGFRANGSPLEIFVADPDARPLDHLAGGRHLPPFWTIDWRMFFDFGEGELQRARRIDTQLAGGLGQLPKAEEGMKVLASLNLRRGRAMGLPSGEAVARRLCLPTLAPPEMLRGREAPLWFYVLSEAEQLHGGECLGPVGSTIIAETMLGMLDADPFSFLRTDPSWKPVIPSRDGAPAEDWDFADLLSYAVPVDGRNLQKPETPPPPPPGQSGWGG